MLQARERGWVTLALGLLYAALLVVRPLAYHVPLGRVLVFWAFVLLAVGLPGVALVWAAGFYRRDRALLVGQGLTLGVTLHGLFFLAGRVLELEPLVHAFPLAAVAVAAVLARRRKETQESAPGAGRPSGLLLVLLLGCLMQPLTTLHLFGRPEPVDLLYHDGNAAELRHRWPLEDPRVAGLPLNYPVLAYVMPVAAARASGLPVADALHGLATLFWVGLLALQTHNAGRVLLGDGGGATLGTAVLLLHEDVGGFLGLGRGAFSSALATAVYGSPTTVCGLILVAALVIVISEVLETPGRLRVAGSLLFVFGLAASLTKATVVPTVVGGCCLVAVLAGVKRRFEVARVAVVCALLLAVTAAPFTLRLGTGETSYRGILKWDPGAIVRQSPFARHVSATPAAPGWITALTVPVWLVGYLGLGGIGALVFLLRRRSPPSAPQVLALGVAVAGTAPALLLDAHGLSQLFFLYNGQLLLGILAGGGLAEALRSRPAPRGLLIVLGLAALPALDGARRVLVARPGQDHAAATRALEGDVADYATGLAWLRAHAAQDVVVFADNPSLLLSAFGECRMYYETGLYTPRGWQRRWEGTSEPFPERVAFQEALLRRPGPEVLSEARRLFPPPVEVMVVADSVQSSVDSGFLRVAIGAIPARSLLPPAWFEAVFVNRVMHVYRLKPSEPPPATRDAQGAR